MSGPSVSLTLAGAPVRIAFEAEESLGCFMERVRAECLAGELCVSSIRVDGREFVEPLPEELADLRLRTLESVQVALNDPRGLALETLEILDTFLDDLAGTCRSRGGADPETFRTIIDGLSTLADSVIQVKAVLNPRHSEDLSRLEQELLSLLQEIVSAREAGVVERDELFRVSLPLHLEMWRSCGLVALRA